MSSEQDARAMAVIAASLPGRAMVRVLAALETAWRHSWTRRLAADSARPAFWAVVTAVAAVVVLVGSWLAPAAW